MKLSKLEIDLLQHRLDAPDCIAEALDLDEAEISCAIARVGKTIRSAGWSLDRLSNLERRILADCIDGSTWAVDWDQMTASERAAVRGVDSKIGKALGVEVPRQ